MKIKFPVEWKKFVEEFYGENDIERGRQSDVAPDNEKGEGDQNSKAQEEQMTQMTLF